MEIVYRTTSQTIASSVALEGQYRTPQAKTTLNAPFIIREMNRWNIPNSLEREVIQRDMACVYCGISFEYPNERVGDRPSWEHIINDTKVINRENIVLCCRSCNSSKGARPLSIWLESAYCKRKGIDKNTVATVVKMALKRGME